VKFDELVPLIFSSFIYSGKELLRDEWHRFLWAGCFSCHQTNSLKALYEMSGAGDEGLV